MIEYALLLYWLPNMQPFDYTIGGKKPLVTFPTQKECEAFRPKVDPRFYTDCEKRDVAEKPGPGPAGAHVHAPGDEEKRHER